MIDGLDETRKQRHEKRKQGAERMSQYQIIQGEETKS